MNGSQGCQKLEFAPNVNLHIGTEKRKCSKCGKTKGNEFFYKSTRNHWCKNCSSVVRKEYYLNNKERVLKEFKISYLKNKEKYLKRSKEYKRKIRAISREKDHQYCIKNREIINKRTKTHAFKQKVKWLILFREKGLTKCFVCGYSKCFDALHFHHKNPKDKKFNIGWIMKSPISKEKMEELDKCILVCANCHCEIHAKNGIKLNTEGGFEWINILKA